MRAKAKFHYAIWFEAGSKLVADRFEAKFHYAIWFDAGSKLVADRFEAGRGPPIGRAGSLLTSYTVHDRPNFSSLQVCDHLRASSESDSVMEFGLNTTNRVIDIFTWNI